MSTIHIALTGHRPPNLGGYNIHTPEYQRLQADLEQYIKYQLSQHTTVWCHSGLALGADTVWSKAILSMKKKYPNNVFFHAEIPFLEQAHPWFKKSDVQFWNEQVERADDKTVYDPSFGAYKTSHSNADQKRRAANFLQKRNIGMIDHADVLLAVYNNVSKEHSGTYNAIQYAQSQHKDIVFIDSNTYFHS